MVPRHLLKPLPLFFAIIIMGLLCAQSFNVSFSAKNLEFKATVNTNLFDRNQHEYAWFLSGNATNICNFEDWSESFEEVAPRCSVTYPSGYGYSGTLQGTLEDTYYDDNAYLSVRKTDGVATLTVTIDIDTPSGEDVIPDGEKMVLVWEAYARGEDIVMKLRWINTSGVLVEETQIEAAGTLTRYVDPDIRSVQIYLRAASGEVGVDVFVAMWGGAAGSIQTEVRYVPSVAGTTSKGAGISPLFDTGVELYGYYAVDVCSSTGTHTFIHEYDVPDMPATSALADFCIFVNYVTNDPNYVSYVKLIVEYVFTSGTVDYIVYFASGESGTFEEGNGYIMYRVGVKTLWIGLKTFNEKQPQNLASISGHLQKLRIKVEMSVASTTTNEPRIEFVVDWIGAWQPQDEISSIKYSLFYEVSQRGFQNLSIATMPTLDYDSSRYRQVLLFYDTRYPAMGNGWVAVDSVYSALESYLPQLGFAVSRVDANELYEYLSGGTKCIVIVLSSVLPDTVYDPPNDNYLIRDWIRNSGGVLVWGGDWIGYYVGHSDGSKTAVGQTGDEKVLGVNILDWGALGTYGVERYKSYENNTVLGDRLGIADCYFARPVVIEYYEENEGGNYLLFRVCKAAVKDIENKTRAVARYGLGWFKFGQGWALVYPESVTGEEGHDFVKMIAVAPFRQNKNAANIVVWDENYITGSAFEDDAFAECNKPDKEDPAEGFGENFADISDWSTGYSTAYTAFTFTTDGDKATLYGEFAADGSTGRVAKHISFSAIDLARYPFLEVRWCGETNRSSLAVQLHFNDGSDNAVWLSVLIRTASFDWIIERLNIYEYVRSRYSWNAYYIDDIVLIVHEQGDFAQYGKIVVDWIRVYGLRDYSAKDIWNSVREACWASSDGDVVTLAAYCNQEGTYEGLGLYIYRDIPIAADTWLELRVKGQYRVTFRLYDTDTGDYYWPLIVGVSDDWVVERMDLGQYYSQGYDVINVFWIEVADDANGLPSVNGWAYAYYDYIKIGKRGDWRPIWEFSAAKQYDSPGPRFYDSIISPRWNLPENIPVGVYRYTIGVLILAFGYNSYDGWMYGVKQIDVAEIRAIHAYSWGYVEMRTSLKPKYGWPPNLAMIPLPTWLLWELGMCTYVVAAVSRKRRLVLPAVLIVLLGSIICATASTTFRF